MFILLNRMEVRFQNGDIIYQAVYHAVSEALHEKELIPEISLEKEGLSASQPKLPVRETPRMPEPFETKRLAQMVKEPESVYGARMASQIPEIPEPPNQSLLKEPEVPKQSGFSAEPANAGQDRISSSQKPSDSQKVSKRRIWSSSRSRRSRWNYLMESFWIPGHVSSSKPIGNCSIPIGWLR